MPRSTALQNGSGQMPARSSSDNVQAVRQRRSREDMNAAKRTLNERARTAASKRRDLGEARESRERLERTDARFSDVGSGTLMGYLLVGLLPFAVWIFDVLFLNQAAEYLIGLGNSFARAMAEYGAYIISAAVILIEMVMSRQRQVAKAEATQYGELARSEDWAAHRKWSIASGIMALVMPILVGSAILARELPGAGFSGMSPKKWGLVVGAVLFALVLHGIMIYAGAWMHDARNYMLYRLRHGRRRRKTRSAEDASEQADTRVAEQLATYQEAHTLCNRLHPEEEIDLGPFNAHVRTAVNAHYGYPYIPAPDGPDEGDTRAEAPAPSSDGPVAPGVPGSAPLPSPPPSEPEEGMPEEGMPSGDGALSPAVTSEAARPAVPREGHERQDEGQAMADYYRSVAEAQRRDADGEVSL